MSLVNGMGEDEVVKFLVGDSGLSECLIKCWWNYLF